MIDLIVLVFIVVSLLLFIQGRSSHSKIKEGLKLTREIHTVVVTKRQEAGEVVDKHVALNKKAGEQLTEQVQKNEE